MLLLSLSLLTGSSAAQEPAGGWTGAQQDGDDPEAEQGAEDPEDDKDPEDPEAEQGPEPSDELVPPAILTTVEAPYPAGLDEGEVHVDMLLLVAEDGSVEEVTLVSGPEPFGELAVEAVQQFTFSPATEGGVPIAVELPFRYTFPRPPVNISVQVELQGLEGPVGPQTVRINDTEYTTDAHGRIELRNQPLGPYRVELVHAAFEAEPAEVELGAEERLDITLQGRAAVEETTLLGVYRRRRPAAVERTITAEEVRTTPGTMGDPLRAVANLPGVVRTPLDAGWLLVRGGDPEDTGLYIDGVRVPLIYHLGGYTSVLHPKAVDEVTFMPGGYDARYGRATGGAVELTTRDVGDAFQAEAGVDLISSGAYVEAPAFGGLGGVAASARRSYLDAVLEQVPGITEEQSRAAPRFWDWTLNADRGPFGAFVFGYADTIDAPTGNRDETVTITIGTLRVHGEADFTLGNRDYRFSPFYAHDWRRIELSGLNDMQLEDRGGGRLESADRGTGNVGYSYGLDANFGWFGTRVNQQDAEGRFGSADPYASVRVGTGTSATLGLRGETLWILGQTFRMAPSPRADFRHEVSDATQLVADFGLYHQWPPTDVAVAFPGGPYLPMEESWGGGAGVRTQWRDLDFTVDAYTRELSRIVIFEDDESLGVGQGIAYGLETMTRYDLHPLSGWVSYSYTRSLRREERGDLYEPHTYDQPHYLVVVSALDLGRDWVLAGRFRYASGYFLRDTDQAFDILTQQVSYLTANPNGRLDPFHSLDLKISREFELRGWDLDVYLDIQNVYNRRVPEPAITGISNQDTIYTYGLFTLPIFGIKGAFGAGR